MRLVNGQIRYVKDGDAQREICCDCGLAHYQIYRVKGKKIAITVFRDDWTTHIERSNRVKSRRRKK